MRGSKYENVTNSSAFLIRIEFAEKTYCKQYFCLSMIVGNTVNNQGFQNNYKDHKAEKNLAAFYSSIFNDKTENL